MEPHMPTVVTRFAPSPTGFLHIGGARTALFNWLFARHHGGKFLLRIEDTDRERSTDANIDAIINGMDWLGLDSDGEPISQYERADRHREVALALLDAGKAYKCYATSEELADLRDKSRADGVPMRGDLWRDRDESEAPEGAKAAIRLKMPREGDVTISDAVQGDVTVQNSELDDMVLLRADGNPTYMLAVVVDDHDMGITHVIRGNDHLNNAFRQYQLYAAMDWDIPIFAHIPLIHGPDGKKLSKRHGALGVEAYRDMGYLPETMRNYLARLGWAHGDDEIFTTEQAIEWFDLDHVVKSPARFDFDKLDNLSGHYIRESDNDFLLNAILEPLSVEVGHELTLEETTRLLTAMTSIKDRAKKIPELIELSVIYTDCRPVALNEKAATTLSQDVRDMLGRLAASLKDTAPWSEDAIKDTIMKFAEAEGTKMGKVMQPVRAALTGGRPSGDLTEIMITLDQDQTLARLMDVVPT